MLDPTRMTASKLRANVYRVLDQVLETGVPVEIERHGRRVRIAPVGGGRVRGASKLSGLKRRPGFLRCAPDDIVHIDWSREWRP